MLTPPRTASCSSLYWRLSPYGYWDVSKVGITAHKGEDFTWLRSLVKPPPGVKPCPPKWNRGNKRGNRAESFGHRATLAAQIERAWLGIILNVSRNELEQLAIKWQVGLPFGTRGGAAR